MAPVVDLHILSDDDNFPLYLSQPVHVADGSWSPALARGTFSVFNNNLVSAWLSAAPAATAYKMRTFRYLTCDLKVTILVQGSAPAQGQLVAYAVPLMKNKRADLTKRSFDYDTYNNSRILPHVVIDPSKSATYEINLPMASITGVYDLQNINTTGSWGLRWLCYQPLGFGTDTTANVGLVVRVSLVNARVTGRTHYLSKGLGPAVPENSSKLSSILSGLSRAAGSVPTSFPVIGPYATLFSSVTSGASSALQALGFAKPPALDQPIIRIAGTCEAYSQVDGDSTALVLGRSQAQESSVDPGLMAGTLEDMSIVELLSKPVLHTDTAINTSMTTGDEILAFDVTPTDLTVGTDNPSFMGVMSSHHNWWQGSMDLRFEFIASVFHRATVLIAWEPTTLGAVGYSDAVNQLENLTVQISGNTCVTITIPWRQPHVVNRIPEPNGKVRLFLVNQVTTNGGIEPIRVNVMKSSRDLKFFAPSMPYLTAYATTTYLSEGLKPNTDWIETSSHSFGAPSTMEPSILACGDQTTSLKDLTSRYAYFYYNQNTTGVMIPAFPTDAVASTTTGQLWYSLLRPMFQGSRASFRWSARANSPEQARMPNVSAAHFLGKDILAPVNNPVTSSLAGLYAFSYANLGTQSCCDIAVPYMYPQLYYPGTSPARDGSNNYIFDERAVLFTSPDFYEMRSFCLMGSAGDDAVFGNFLGVPKFTTPTIPPYIP